MRVEKRNIELWLARADELRNEAEHCADAKLRYALREIEAFYRWVIKRAGSSR